MFDLIVTGGTAVFPTGTEVADIGIAGGKIAAIGGPGSLADIGAARVVDAARQIVIPGGVDPHIHCSSPIPFPGRNEDLLSAGQPRRAPWRHDHVARFRPMPAGSAAAA